MLVCSRCVFFFFFFKQKTAYEMRISDWSSDVCSSDLRAATRRRRERRCGSRRRGHRRLGKHSMNPVRPEEPLSLSKGRLEGPAQVVRDASSSSSAAPHHERLWVQATATPPSRPWHTRNAAPGGTAPRRPPTTPRP